MEALFDAFLLRFLAAPEQASSALWCESERRRNVAFKVAVMLQDPNKPHFGQRTSSLALCAAAGLWWSGPRSSFRALGPGQFARRDGQANHCSRCFLLCRFPLSLACRVFEPAMGKHAFHRLTRMTPKSQVTAGWESELGLRAPSCNCHLPNARWCHSSALAMGNEWDESERNESISRLSRPHVEKAGFRNRLQGMAKYLDGY